MFQWGKTCRGCMEVLVEVRLEGADRDFAFLSSSFILFNGRQRILSMIGLNQCRGVYMVC